MNSVHIFALFAVYFLHHQNSKIDIIAERVPHYNIANYALYFNIFPLLFILYAQVGNEAYEHIYIMVIYTMLYNVIVKAVTPESKNETYISISIACYLSLIYNEKIKIPVGYSAIALTSFLNLSNKSLTTYGLLNELLLVHFLFFVSKT